MPVDHVFGDVRVLFIVGNSRSGTTMLGRVLVETQPFTPSVSYTFSSIRSRLLRYRTG